MDNNDFFSLDRLLEFGLGMGMAQQMINTMNQSMKYSLLEAVLRLPRYWKEEKEAREKAL